MDLDTARDRILDAVRKKPAVNTMFAYNDEFTLIVLQVLHAAASKSPGDIAVMGSGRDSRVPGSHGSL